MATWCPIKIYDKLASMCFVLEPLERGAFSDIVEAIENVLSIEEKDDYIELTEQYSSMRELMEDSMTQLK